MVVNWPQNFVLIGGVEITELRLFDNAILAGELDSAPAARLPAPTPVVTRSDALSRSETTTTMVLRSRIQRGRSSAIIPEMES